jgi:hypothetical protein
MGTMIYYVALAFMRSEDGGDIVACDPRRHRIAEQAIRMVPRWRRRIGIPCFASAFSQRITTTACTALGGP